MLMAEGERSMFQDGSRSHPKSWNEGPLIPHCVNSRGSHGRPQMAGSPHSALALEYLL